ncbi:glycosyltransferase family 4 protein [Candidatus Gottesmanbacteria bacterium]|nr:glycosyltransferase family 4 protein [Candidatus Gottesmanbacteria bacterium]
MRIAILGSVALPVPPPAQGGTEWIAYYQAKGLSERGHKVILFSAKGSKKENYELVEVGMGDTVAGSNIAMGPAARVSQGDASSRSPLAHSPFGEASLGNPSLASPALLNVESSRNLRKENVYLARVVQHLIDRKYDYDIILNNMRGEAIFLPVAKMLNKPFVNVMHLPLFDRLAEIFKEYNTHIITISNAQRKEFPDLNYLATVNNCVDTDQYTLNTVPEDYLLMMGSIAPHKNQAGAIRIAKKLGMKLVLAGKIGNQDYFDSLKADIDGTEIKWIGELAFPDKLKLYQKAKVFIFPILWQEPFGLVLIEAMACGTPVVAFGNGAITEVVVDRKTGFVIDNDSEENMIEAIKKIDSINRTDCRKYVEENFSVNKIVGDYEKTLFSI